MPELAEETSQELRILIESLLEIDRSKRISPKELYEEVLGRNNSPVSSSTISLISNDSRDSTPTNIDYYLQL